MTENELNKWLDFVLYRLSEHRDLYLNAAYDVTLYNSDDFEDLKRNDIYYVISKLVAYGLAREASHKHVVFITPRGIEVQAAGGWLKYVSEQKEIKQQEALSRQRKEAANQLKEKEEMELNRVNTAAVKRSANGAYLAVGIALIALFLPIKQYSESRNQNIEISEIKREVKRLDSLLKARQPFSIQTRKQTEDALGIEYVWGFSSSSKTFDKLPLAFITAAELINEKFTTDNKAYCFISSAENHLSVANGYKIQSFGSSEPLVTLIPVREIDSSVSVKVIPNKIIFWDDIVKILSRGKK